MKQLNLFKKIPHFKKCNKVYTKWNLEYLQNLQRHKNIFPEYYLSRGFLHGGATGDIPLKQLGTANLGSPASSLTLTSLATKKYLLVEIYTAGSSSTDNVNLRVGNGSADTGSNYADSISVNGGSDSTNTSGSSIHITSGAGFSYPTFTRIFIVNVASSVKLMIINEVGQNTAGAGNAPTRYEASAKWQNTTNQIDTLKIDTFSADTYSSGSYITAWGSD